MRLHTATVTIDDLDRFIERLDVIGDRYGCTIQAFDARYVACSRQIERAVELAGRAFERGENVARDRAVEILLYAAGRRQIDRALEMGVKPGSGPAVFVIDADDGSDTVGGPPTSPDDRERKAIEAIAEFVDPEPGPVDANAQEDRIEGYFDITSEERAVTGADLCSLVCERVALLDVEK